MRPSNRIAETTDKDQKKKQSNQQPAHFYVVAVLRCTFVSIIVSAGSNYKQRAIKLNYLWSETVGDSLSIREHSSRPSC